MKDVLAPIAIPPDVKERLTRKQMSMADTFLSIANAPKEDTEQLDEFLGPQAAKNVDALLKRGQKVLDRMGVPINRTKRPCNKRTSKGKKEECEIIVNLLYRVTYALRQC